MTTQAIGTVEIVQGQVWPTDYDLIIIVRASESPVKTEWAQAASRHTDQINRLYQDCRNDQQTSDGAPVVLVVGLGSGAEVLKLENGEQTFTDIGVQVMVAWLNGFFTHGRQFKRIAIGGLPSVSELLTVGWALSRRDRAISIIDDWCGRNAWYD